MATSQEFIEYVYDSIKHFGFTRYKKMFGEYMIYVDEKPILLICDNTVFVKIVPQTIELMVTSGKGFPYNGAKEHYVLDVEDFQLLEQLIPLLIQITPLPKKKI